MKAIGFIVTFVVLLVKDFGELFSDMIYGSVGRWAGIWLGLGISWCAGAVLGWVP